MIEQKIEALTNAIVALTAAITVAGGAPAAAAPAAPAKPAKSEKPAAPAKAAPKHSKGEMQAAVNEVKENFDTATAKALIKAAGFDKLADVTEDKFDEIYDAAKAKMEELSGGSGDGL